MEVEQYSMPASFVAAAPKIFSGVAPRFVVVTGTEPGLRSKIIEFYDKQPCEIHTISCKTDTMFLPAVKRSQAKIVIIKNAESFPDWDWLPAWFNKAKNMRLIVEVVEPLLAKTLEKKANTRGIAIDCSVPSGEKNRAKLVQQIHQWYGASTSQLNLLFSRNDWNVSACLQLLDKLALLQLPLTSENEQRLGVVRDPTHQFLEALYMNTPAKAISFVSKLSYNEICAIIEQLADWLQKMVSVKISHTPLKQDFEIARELGLQPVEVNNLIRQGRRFSMDKASKLSLVIAQADMAIANGAKKGVLEDLVGNW